MTSRLHAIFPHFKSHFHSQKNSGKMTESLVLRRAIG